jgi:hypothetical protein
LLSKRGVCIIKERDSGFTRGKGKREEGRKKKEGTSLDWRSVPTPDAYFGSV